MENSTVLKSEFGREYSTGSLTGERSDPPDLLRSASVSEKLPSGFVNFIATGKGCPNNATCVDPDGMWSGSSVAINGDLWINKFITRGDDSGVWDIEARREAVYGDFSEGWVIWVHGSGPKSGWTTGLKLWFEDMTGDKYSLDIIRHSREFPKHYVRYDSDNGRIKRIWWDKS